jgi:hypothetical protein
MICKNCGGSETNNGRIGRGSQAKIISVSVVFLERDEYYKAILNWKR